MSNLFAQSVPTFNIFVLDDGHSRVIVTSLANTRNSALSALEIGEPIVSELGRLAAL